MRVSLSALLLALALSASAYAQSQSDAGTAAPALSAPSSAELKKVIDYYYQGKAQGPVLVELKACLKIVGSNRSECADPINGPIKKGTTVYGWTLWFVPEGGSYDDAFIQFVHEGQVRSTIDLKLSQAFRSRVWRPSVLHKSGKWEIRALRGAQVLSTVALTVED